MLSNRCTRTLTQDNYVLRSTIEQFDGSCNYAS